MHNDSASGRKAVIYHWWSDKHPKMEFRCPILCSIASLRLHNPNVSIYVLDASTKSHTEEWKKYTKLLNFKAIPYIPYFKRLGYTSDFYSLTETSRLVDIYNFSQTIPEHVVMYSDSDVFYVKSIENELTPQARWVSPVFTAYFYFDKREALVHEFVLQYEGFARRAFQDKEFLEEMKKCCPYNVYGRQLWSEVITYYIDKTPQVEYVKKLIEPIDLVKFANIDTALRNNRIGEAILLHLFYNGMHGYDEMDAVALFKEFREPVDKLLGKDFIPSIKNVPERLSLYDDSFQHYISDLMRNTDRQLVDGFIRESINFARNKHKN